MSEKRIMVLDAELLKKIDDNRGEMGRAEFLNFLIDSRLSEESLDRRHQNYVDKEEFQQFAQGIRELMRNFLEFFLSYGLELGKQPKDLAFEELTRKLQELESRSKRA